MAYSGIHSDCKRKCVKFLKFMTIVKIPREWLLSGKIWRGTHFNSSPLSGKNVTSTNKENDILNAKTPLPVPNLRAALPPIYPRQSQRRSANSERNECSRARYDLSGKRDALPRSPGYDRPRSVRAVVLHQLKPAPSEKPYCSTRGTRKLANFHSRLRTPRREVTNERNLGP